MAMLNAPHVHRPALAVIATVLVLEVANVAQVVLALQPGSGQGSSGSIAIMHGPSGAYEHISEMLAPTGTAVELNTETHRQTGEGHIRIH